MTLLAPLWLFAGIAGALGVLALHFIARQRPAPMILPTARFVPDVPARAASRAPRPTDLLLLVMRALVVLLLGLAFAGPLLRPQRVLLARVVMVDRSAAVGAPDSIAAAALMHLRPGDVLVAFDTAVRAVGWADGDTIPPATAAPADFGAALLVAMREARHVSSRADSIELVLVSPMDAASWNEAVLPIRAAWPGRIRVELTPGAVPDSTGSGFEIRAEPGDPLAATAALLGAPGGEANGIGRVRLIRDAPTAADSSWARDSNGALVLWPRDSAGLLDSALLSGSGAVVAHDVVAVAAWQRRRLPEGRTVAWWADGSPAAIENPLGSGCVRSVAIGVPEAGDVALARSTQRLLNALTSPCGASTSGAVADSIVERVAGSGPLVAGTRLVRAGVHRSPATPWLLAAGLALLLLEWMARRRMVRA